MDSLPQRHRWATISDHPKAMTQRRDDASNIFRFLPKLTVNGQFMRDFRAEESLCFALGLVEERKQLCGFLALRPAEVIPPEISGLGFNFGHTLLGTTEFEVIQFVFHFYGAGVLASVSDNSHLLARSEQSERFSYVALRLGFAFSGRGLRIQRHINGKAT